MSSPEISIIVPVRNEAARIGDLLDQLLRQTYPSERYEIIVVDGRSTDATCEVVRARAMQSNVSIRVVDNSGIRSSAGRNAGVAVATGEIVLFIDGHCEIPSRDLLADTVRIMESTGASCLCRPQPLVAFHPKGIGKIVAEVRASSLGHGRDSLIYDMVHTGFVHPASSGATYRREIFDRIGNYDENFDACEDVEFNTRVAALGYQAYTDPRLAVYYEPRGSFTGLFQQMMRYGVGRVRLARKHPQSASIFQWVPAALVAFAIAAGISVLGGGLTGNWWVTLCAAPFALFLLLTFAASFNLGRRLGWAHTALGPIAYLTIYMGLGIGTWKELLLPGRERSRQSADISAVPQSKDLISHGSSD